MEKILIVTMRMELKVRISCKNISSLFGYIFFFSFSLFIPKILL